MKRLALLLALGLSTLLLPAARADTVDLGTHGVLTLKVPTGWTMKATPDGNGGTTVALTPPPSANAAGLFNVVVAQAGAPAVTRDQIKEQALAVGDEFVSTSVEKKKNLRELTLATGFGYYCVFTDASLVGQAPVKGQFKVVGVGLVCFRDDVMAAVGISADDEKSPEFTALLDILGSATLSAAK